MNWRRSSLAAIQRPLVIWLPRYAIVNLAEYAPDFYDWYSNVYEFIPPAKDFEQEKGRFITEFTKNDVHPADRMTNAEKQEWLHTLTALLAENSTHNSFRAQLLGNAGRLHQAIGNFDDALEQYGQSLEISQEIGDNAGLCATLFTIGHIHWQKEEKQEAMGAWVQVYLVAKKLNLAQALQALEGLAKQLDLDGGMAAWLAQVEKITTQGHRA